MQTAHLIRLETLLLELQADQSAMAGLSLIEQCALSNSVEIVHSLHRKLASDNGFPICQEQIAHDRVE